MIRINLETAEAERIKNILLQSDMFKQVELETKDLIGFRTDLLAKTNELPQRVIIFEIKWGDIVAQDIVYKIASVKSWGQKQFPTRTVIAVLVVSGELTPDAMDASKKLDIVIRSFGEIKDGNRFLSELERSREEIAIPFEIYHRIEVLKSIPAGKKYAIQYELACGEILKYLFYPPLGEPSYQAADSSRANRRDWIFPNSCQTGFWADIRNLYQGYEIVFDMKNSGVNIQKQSVLQIGCLGQQ